MEHTIDWKLQISMTGQPTRSPGDQRGFARGWVDGGERGVVSDRAWQYLEALSIASQCYLFLLLVRKVVDWVLGLQILDTERLTPTSAKL